MLSDFQFYTVYQNPHSTKNNQMGNPWNRFARRFGYNSERVQHRKVLSEPLHTHQTGH